MKCPGKRMMRWFLALALLVLVLAMAFWAIRPSPYGDWLGLAGLYQETPLFVAREWFNESRSPRTPVGFLSLFPASDLLIAGALITAISIVLILLWNPGRDAQPESGLTRPIRVLHFRGVSVRVRTILVIIAILALELGCEVVGWRTWRLRDRYLRETRRFMSAESYYKQQLNSIRTELANLEARNWLAMYTPAARAAILSHDRDRLIRDATYTSALVTEYSQLRRKYQLAAEDPLRPISPDLPLTVPRPPGQPDAFIWNWRTLADCERALAGFDDLIRLYPDYPDAHHCRAWMLATCPYARIRNGKLAVVDATRACELTNWTVPLYLSTLAAAYAEAGDFANAVYWETKARESSREAFGVVEWGEERITSYKACKPFRTTR